MTESLQGDGLYDLHRCVETKLRIALTEDPDGDFGWQQAEAARRKKGAAGVSANEYDFTHVPEDELLDCIHYEYARESARIIKGVAELRRYFRELITKDQIVAGQKFQFASMVEKFTTSYEVDYDVHLLLALAGHPEFPAVAWLALTDRHTLKNFHNNAVCKHKQEFHNRFPVFIADVIPENIGLPALTLESWESKSLPPLFNKLSENQRRRTMVTGFMMVNFSNSPKLIVEEFKKWLLERHPDANKPAPEKRGRNSPKDKLNALGALRLRFYCRTLQEAQKTIAPLQQANGMTYSDRTAWNRACRSACKHFLEVLDLPDGDRPIHFTDGW